MAKLHLITETIDVEESREDIIDVIEANTIDQNSIMYGSYGGDFIELFKEE